MKFSPNQLMWLKRALNNAIDYEGSLIDAYSQMSPDDKSRREVEKTSGTWIKEFKKLMAKINQWQSEKSKASNPK